MKGKISIQKYSIFNYSLPYPLSNRSLLASRSIITLLYKRKVTTEGKGIPPPF